MRAMMKNIPRSMVWILLTFFINVTCERIVFELWPRINNIVLDRPLLQSPVISSKPHQCAKHCTEHPKCSMFGYNLITGSCALFGDILFRDGDLTNHLDGQRYFVVRKAWCPLKHGFLVFRRSGLCVWYSDIKTTWTLAQGICESLTGRLVALSSEDKMIAVVEAVYDMENMGGRFHVGGSDIESEDVWVWSDGTLLSYDAWTAYEPDGRRKENCMSIKNRLFVDVSCYTHRDTNFICEIAN